MPKCNNSVTLCLKSTRLITYVLAYRLILSYLVVMILKVAESIL